MLMSGYLSDGYAGLEIIDVSNPAAPVWAGGYCTGGFLSGLKLLGTEALVSDVDLGLLMLDLGNPAIPQIQARMTNLGIVNGFQVAGLYAYVACNDGLRVVDVSSRTNLLQVLMYPKATPVCRCSTQPTRLTSLPSAQFIPGVLPTASS